MQSILQLGLIWIAMINGWDPGEIVQSMSMRRGVKVRDEERWQMGDSRMVFCRNLVMVPGIKKKRKHVCGMNEERG